MTQFHSALFERQPFLYLAVFLVITSVLIVPEAKASSSERFNLLEQTVKKQAEMIERLQRLVETQGNQIAELRQRDATGTQVVEAEPPPPEPARIGQKPQQPEPRDVYVPAEVGGILTRQGNLILEPSIEYSYSTLQRVEISGFTVLPAILVGSIDIRRVNRNTLIGSLTARYGLTDRFEIDLKLPYVYRDDTTITRTPFADSFTEDSFSADGHDIGDVEFGAHYQLSKRAGWPYLVTNLRIKSDTGKSPFEVKRDPATQLETEKATGTGFWGIEPSLTWIYPTDPVVLYGNVSYLWHIEEDQGREWGDIDPGDSYGTSIGVGLALNEKFSLTFGYEYKIVDKMKQDGKTIPGSVTQYVGSLQVGGSYLLSDMSSLNFSVYAGITEDAPDARVIVRVPIGFNLFD